MYQFLFLSIIYLFSMSGYDQPDSIQVINKANGEQLSKIEEVLPIFPGGEKALFSFIHKNFQYPKSAKADRIEGRVYVTFVVNKLGSVEQVMVKKGIREDVDEAAVALIKSMPNWIPGTQNGEAVNVQYMLPVNVSWKKRTY